MDEDLRKACLDALRIDRATAREHAERYSWRAATEQFVRHLHPVTGADAPRRQVRTAAQRT